MLSKKKVWEIFAVMHDKPLFSQIAWYSSLYNGRIEWVKPCVYQDDGGRWIIYQAQLCTLYLAFTACVPSRTCRPSRIISGMSHSSHRSCNLKCEAGLQSTEALVVLYFCLHFAWGTNSSWGISWSMHARLPHPSRWVSQPRQRCMNPSRWWCQRRLVRLYVQIPASRVNIYSHSCVKGEVTAR